MIVEYTLQNIDQPIGASSYRVTRELPAPIRDQVPTVEDLQEVIGKLREEIDGLRGTMSLELDFVICAAGCCTIPILQQPIAKLSWRGQPVSESLTGRRVRRKLVTLRSALEKPRCVVRML